MSQLVLVGEDAELPGRAQDLRQLEALLFSSAEPLGEEALARRMPEGSDVRHLLRRLQADYAMRGINLVQVAGGWAFRTARDLGWLLAPQAEESKKLSRAALETLAIIAYHQPVTRADIEDIRGVSCWRGTLDVLLETGWVRLRGRRRAPGRPVTFGTSAKFLDHFGLGAISDLPGLEDLKAAGLIEGKLPSGFGVPVPNDDTTLAADEDPLEGEELDLGLAPRADDDEA